MRLLRQKTGMPRKCPQPPGKTEDPKLLSFPFLCNDDGKQHSKYTKQPLPCLHKKT